jgi:hypothetical protein
VVLLEDNHLPRERATSEREDRLIRLWATRVRSSTAATFQNELVEATETRISTQKTLNRLHDREFNPRRPANVPPLSPDQRKAKRLFACSRTC